MVPMKGAATATHSFICSIVCACQRARIGPNTTSSSLFRTVALSLSLSLSLPLFLSLPSLPPPLPPAPPPLSEPSTDK